MENKRLSILEGLDSYLPSVDGVVTCMHNTCLNLCKMCDVTAMVPRNKRGYVDDFPYKVVRCKSTYLPFLRIYYGSPSTDSKFNKQIMSQYYDIVHVHSPYNMAKYAVKVAKKKNIPLVATFHTNFRTIFQDIFKSRAITEGLVQNLGDFYNKCDEVFVCSPQIAEQARSFGYKGKISYIPFGSDYKLCQDVKPLIARANEKYNLKDDEIVFLYTGRIMALKRIDFIIDSLKICKDKGLKFKFFVVGKGMQMEALKKQVKKLEMENEVSFLGFVEQCDLDALYARANLLLFPSLYDNFGLVKVEAAAFWTAGIYIKDSQAGYGVTHGQNGFLTEDNLEAFSQGIIDATSDMKKLEQIGINASKELYMSWEDCTKVLYKRLQEIVEEMKGKTPMCARPTKKKRTKRDDLTTKEKNQISKRAKSIAKQEKDNHKKLVDKFYNEM